MKKLVWAVGFVLIFSSLNAQDIIGQWNGILKFQGVQLRLVFNIEKVDTIFAATMDSPDQGANGIPVKSVSFKNSVLKLELPNIFIQYEGILNDESTIVGNFKQGAISIPLTLTKEIAKKEVVIRPQEPQKPYGYYTEDVYFENRKENFTLAGTLSLPQKEGIFPAVILISGSGPQNRDEEVFGHKPFLVLSDYLTKNGIAVLRFDDRGTAESKGNFQTATSFDFAIDVESAANYLRSRKEINKKKIGLIGHSEGGIIAPMLAAKDKEISFIVLLAGTGIIGSDLLLLQQELIGRANGISETELQKSKKESKAAFDLIQKFENNDSLKLELGSFIKQHLDDEILAQIQNGMSLDDFIKNQVDVLTTPWMYNFLNYDPSIILEKVKCPVLALNGSKDLQVPSKINLDAIETALKKAKNKNITIKELAGLNHLFQECETGSPVEYAKIEQTFSPTALKEIADWIKSQW
jgi:hypothetical protein